MCYYVKTYLNYKLKHTYSKPTLLLLKHAVFIDDDCHMSSVEMLV